MTNPYTDPMMETYQSKRIVERNALAEKLRGWRGWGGYYHKRLANVYSHMIPAGASVLEIGCNTLLYQKSIDLEKREWRP